MLQYLEYKNPFCYFTLFCVFKCLVVSKASLCAGCIKVVFLFVVAVVVFWGGVCKTCTSGVNR